MYTLPQEIEVWYIIPAIRRELSKCLTRDFKVSYEKVGNMLGISKAAVSQYLKNKRASKIRIDPRADKEIMKSCKLLMDKKSNAVVEITRVLKVIKDKGWPVEVCDKHVKGVFEGCREIKTN